MAERKQPDRSNVHGWRTVVFALVALAGLVFVVLRFGDLKRFAEMARSAQPIWLVAAAALQLATYVCLALGWGSVLNAAGKPLSLRKLLPVALSKLFVDQVVPAAGMGGNVLLVDRLIALGVPRGAAVSTLIVSVIGYYAAYGALVVLMMVALWLHHHATALIVGPVTAFLLIALAIPALFLWLRQRGEQALPQWIERLRPLAKLLSLVGQAPKKLVSDKSLIVRVTGWNALIFLADAATLAVCLKALGGPLLPVTAFIALMAASIVVTLAPLPLGLGGFEATSTATLAMLGVPATAALAATLMLRALTLWLPLIPGLWLMRRAARRGKSR